MSAFPFGSLIPPVLGVCECVCVCLRSVLGCCGTGERWFIGPIGGLLLSFSVFLSFLNLSPCLFVVISSLSFHFFLFPSDPSSLGVCKAAAVNHAVAFPLTQPGLTLSGHNWAKQHLS